MKFDHTRSPWRGLFPGHPQSRPSGASEHTCWHPVRLSLSFSIPTCACSSLAAAEYLHKYHTSSSSSFSISIILSTHLPPGKNMAANNRITSPAYKYWSVYWRGRYEDRHMWKQYMKTAKLRFTARTSDRLTHLCYNSFPRELGLVCMIFKNQSTNSKQHIHRHVWNKHICNFNIIKHDHENPINHYYLPVCIKLSSVQ